MQPAPAVGRMLVFKPGVQRITNGVVIGTVAGAS